MDELMNEIIAEKIRIVAAIDEKLKANSYFGLLSDDARQDLLVSILIDCEKAHYFRKSGYNHA